MSLFFGFPRGISGAELAWRSYEQACTFGMHFIYGNPAISLAAASAVGEGSIAIRLVHDYLALALQAT